MIGSLANAHRFQGAAGWKNTKDRDQPQAQWIAAMESRSLIDDFLGHCYCQLFLSPSCTHNHVTQSCCESWERLTSLRFASKNRQASHHRSIWANSNSANAVVLFGHHLRPRKPIIISHFHDMFKAVKPSILLKTLLENQKKFATYLSVQFLAVSPSRRDVGHLQTNQKGWLSFPHFWRDLAVNLAFRVSSNAKKQSN